MAIAMVIMSLTGAPAVPVVEDKPVHHKASCNKACKLIRHKRKVVRPYRAKLERMAYCESTSRWHLNTGNGYYGGLQFDLRTWHSVGGGGYPHWASKLEQMYRAVILIGRRGYRPWPVCGYR